MDDHADFDSVSWPRDPETGRPEPPTPPADGRETTLPSRTTKTKRSMSGQNEPQAGHEADAVDLGGIGEGILECTVDMPMKENDGTKDAYVSYLITTNVRQSQACPTA